MLASFNLKIRFEYLFQSFNHPRSFSLIIHSVHNLDIEVALASFYIITTVRKKWLISLRYARKRKGLIFLEHQSSLNHSRQHNVPWKVVDVLLVLIVWRLLLTKTVVDFMDSLFQQLMSSPAIANYIAFIAIHIIQMAVVYLFIIRKYKLTWSNFGLRTPTKKNWAHLVPWAIMANLVSFLALWITFTFFWTDGSSKQEAVESIGFFLSLFMVSVAAPIVEETVNRGVIFTYIRSRFGGAAGIVISGLIFGIGHAPELMLNATIVGFLLAILYNRSGTLWMPIILHAIMNGILIVLYFLL